MGQFKLKVRDLDDGLSDHRFAITGEWLEAQLSDVEGIDGAKEEGEFEVAATKRGREVLLHGVVRAALRITCVRCLEAFPFPIDADLEVLMLPGRPNSARPKDGEGKKEEKDELGVERYQGDEIVLDELTRDTILLEVPMNPSCGDGCPGWDHLHQEGGTK